MFRTGTQLVFQLPSELFPSLIQNGFVQPSPGSDVSSRALPSRCRTGHVPDLQVFHTHHRVALADGCADFMQVVFPDVGYPAVDSLDF